jgi:hypothetical protein
MRLKTGIVGTLVATISLLVLVASPAQAAAPLNDTFAGATVIGAIPFTDSLDTTQATTDADDVSANTDCRAPATAASVWYSLTPSADGGINVDVSGSNFSAGVIVVTGTPGSFTPQVCGPGTVAFLASAGITYHVLAFDDQLDGSGNGGMLNLSVITAPPPPSIDVTVNPTARFDAHTGTATLSGTVLCTGAAAEFSFLDGQLSQKVGSRHRPRLLQSRRGLRRHDSAMVGHGDTGQRSVPRRQGRIGHLRHRLRRFRVQLRLRRAHGATLAPLTTHTRNLKRTAGPGHHQGRPCAATPGRARALPAASPPRPISDHFGSGRLRPRAWAVDLPGSANSAVEL